MRRTIKKLIRRFGYDVVRIDAGNDGFPSDISDDEKRIYRAVKPFTSTSLERVVSLVRAVRYIVDNDIPGAIVECGVGAGGSVMAIALALQQFGQPSRELHLFDTFSGMTPPSEKDQRLYDGFRATQLRAEALLVPGGSFDDVIRNIESCGYPSEYVHYVRGKVEDTLPGAAPAQIALLRLDTDWYESTRHELLHLYPRVVSRGIMILDDYGCWAGARTAVDEYFSGENQKPFLHRIDYTGRLLVKG